MTKIEFTKPSKDWNEALPIGNGRMGAMVYGGVSTELLQLNNDSVWYGCPKDRINPSAKDSLPLIRKALDEGRISDAQELCAFCLSAIPETQSHYEPLGNLYILFEGDESNVTEYRRELDLHDSEVRISYVKDGIRFERSIIASYPDNVIAISLKSSAPQSLSFHTQLSRGKITWDLGPYQKQVYRHPNYNTYVDDIINIDDMTYMTATSGGRDGITMGCAIKVISQGGMFQSLGNSLKVEKADSALILISSTTSFYDDDIKSAVMDTLTRASRKSDLWDAHRKDYKSLFDRTSLELPDEEAVRLFEFGKYLTISGSRKGSQPLNLQGIWNKDFDPMWGSKYTININAEMNYWPCESLDLPECHLPLFDLIDRMRPRGNEVASRMYGMRGFVAHHNTDIWADCAPQDVCLSSSYWIMGAAWLCLHIWDHYSYTCDVEFLKEKFPIMLEASQFLLDYMTEENGQIIFYPSISPENEYRLPNGESGCVCKGASMDDQIAYELFDRCIRAEEILKTGDPLVSEISEALSKIRKPSIASDGSVMEWHEEYEELDPGHRHISHLFGLFPGHTIDSDELKRASRVTLDKRLSAGGGHTGWSRAWIINMYAALGDGEKAYEHIRLLIEKSLLPNLFDDHPPFQIDGNFGLVSGIIRMLVGETGEELPALPSKWKDGALKGFKIRGGKKVDLVWKDGKVIDKKIY